MAENSISPVEESVTNTSSCDASCARVLELTGDDRKQQQHRKIGYAIVEANAASDRGTAIVYFYPMSACSNLVHRMAAWIRQQNFQASFLCVDRPGCGETSMTTVSNGKTPDNNDAENTQQHDRNDPHRNHFALHRIRAHIDDVCSVLRHENIHTVYALGVCLGHPYAVELCRKLCPLSSSSSSSDQSIPICKGLSLVAPFVNAAPKCWKVAQLGAAVPGFVLRGFTEAASAISSFVIKNVLRPHHFEKIITEAELIEFGWLNPKDFQDACDLMVEMSERTNQARAIEARLGASKIWQPEILDKFARENQTRESNLSSSGAGTKQQPQPQELLRIPVRIFASNQDKLLPIEAAHWLGELYGCQITIMSNIHSHEVMTFFAGPPRSPVMLYTIAKEWDLLQDK
jgi:pimeloyl-ACP methyl ester carboxylesterase